MYFFSLLVIHNKEFTVLLQLTKISCDIPQDQYSTKGSQHNVVAERNTKHILLSYSGSMQCVFVVVEKQGILGDNYSLCKHQYLSDLGKPREEPNGAFSIPIHCLARNYIFVKFFILKFPAHSLMWIPRLGTGQDCRQVSPVPVPSLCLGNEWKNLVALSC